MRLATLGILAALQATPALAQTPETPADSVVMHVGEVLVRGARPLTAPGGSAAIVAAIDTLPLPPNPTMEQTLRALPATYLRTNSRGEVEVTVRGSESRQVAILLDGVPLTLAWDGRADVSVIPALAAREIVLVRGLATLLHGPNTLGGVIEFRTRPDDPRAGKRGAQVAAAVDDLGAFGIAGAVTAPKELGWGAFTARAGAGFRDSPGQPLARRVVEPVPTEDDLRLNTDARQTNGFLSLRLDGREGAFVSLLGAGFEAERGIAAQLGVSSPRLWRYPHIARGIGVLSAGSGLHAMPWGGQADLELSAGLDRGRTEIDAYDSRDYANIVSEEDGDDDVLTLRGVLTQTVGERADLRLAFTHADVRHDEILNGVSSAYRQRLWSVAGEAAVPVVPRVDLGVGLAFDGAATPETGGKPPFPDLDDWGGRVGLSARLGTGGTVAHAGVSRRARFPSLRELYSGALGSFEPNPNLEPEDLLAVESGITLRDERAALQLVGFYHLLSDAVVRIRPPGENFQRVNQEGIRSIGGEVLASRSFGKLEVSADAVVQDVEVLDPGAGLSRPENMPELMANARLEAPVLARTKAALETRFVGEQFVLDPETGSESRLAPATRLTAWLSRDWTVGSDDAWFRRLEIRTVVENLTDAPHFEAFGLPQAGRSVRLELRLQ